MSEKTNISRDLQTATKELLSMRGEKVKMHSEECLDFKQSHKENCNGCSHNLACGKYVTILISSMTPDDGSRLDKILDAKTVNELHAIHIPSAF